VHNRYQRKEKEEKSNNMAYIQISKLALSVILKIRKHVGHFYTHLPFYYTEREWEDECIRKNLS